MNKIYEVKSVPIPKFSKPIDIAEGKRIYQSRGCGDCHDVNGSGKTFIDDPAIGTLSGSNLTAGIGGVLSDNTDEELAIAIRDGVGRKGKALIFMPSTDFQGMTNEDVGKLISYLRSTPAVDKPQGEVKPGPLGRFLFLIGEIPVFVSAEIINHERNHLTNITPSISIEYGKYVASTCTGCHGFDLKGGPIQGAPPEWPSAQNISKNGLGHYTEANFIKTIRTGKRPDGSEMKFPMPWKSLGQLTDTELKALWMYLQTIN
ncbi:cytochrome c [Leptospira sp. 2 VSF19]|uniref:Cytochrome c n=1 Tax=Leptospira soteropolitanensis TaxID=2950025 RepID=A0AAW5VIU0_9LEPT|nr:cytochrome c [Leptospira soteropolitanensis]MCW7491271.1 cytochrome c [Leptospira soteropolitanensis]MCW7498856.1 cytochrome c [Leptospira soteropolitanensis]MCW7521552.1 cytochrome c [Leptospira soteropolitanensis]MCW7524959.1 cytochrome c [Leptospira soteropolitanensis]MCW7528827.1 cytochrome c [Leptospira soteropolitanensis]